MQLFAICMQWNTYFCSDLSMNNDYPSALTSYVQRMCVYARSDSQHCDSCMQVTVYHIRHEAFVSSISAMTKGYNVRVGALFW